MVKKTLKIIGIIIFVGFAVAGMFLYSPILIPIAILLLINQIKPNNKKTPPPKNDEVEIFETIDD